MVEPLLAGEIRSCFAMTEPAVASSDATNIEASIVRQGDEYVINGRKWWSSGAGDPRCKVAIFMGRTDKDRTTQKRRIARPRDINSSRWCWCRWIRAGLKIERMLTVFGYDHAPHGHGEITFENVACRSRTCCLAKDEALRLRKDGWGRGAFITACAALAWLNGRSKPCASECRHAWPLASRWPNREPSGLTLRISRMEIEQARLLTLNAAYMMDTAGNKEARAEIAMIKVVAPNVSLRVLDRRFRRMEAQGFRRTRFWPAPGRMCARCVWPMVRTRCIPNRLRRWSYGNGAGRSAGR